MKAGERRGSQEPRRSRKLAPIRSAVGNRIEFPGDQDGDADRGPTAAGGVGLKDVPPVRPGHGKAGVQAGPLGERR